MRFVTVEGKSVSLNFMWLPTFIGHSIHIKKELEKDLRGDIEGLELTEENLDRIHEMIIDWLLKKYPLPGLREYLDGIKFVEG
jgi:hypothetical protein